MDKKQEKNKQSFEQALKRLEEIVNQLETGDVPLEKSIELFQEGIELVNFCNQKLEEVKHKVEMVVRTKEGFTLKPFNTEIKEESSTKEIPEDEDITDDNEDLPF
ncbi:MAG: exodeoxyribonuclease VII small subunit [Endomicrobia bacterium]|nr:exodeoxyribonuclease VII small subunit [Endomicrobiia bacterium]